MGLETTQGNGGGAGDCGCGGLPSALFGSTYVEGNEKKSITPDLIDNLDLSKYGMPTDEHLKEIGVDQITNAKAFQKTVKDVMTQIQQGNTNFEFLSLTQFVNYAKWLAWNTVFAQQLQQLKPQFSTDAAKDGYAFYPGSKYWESSDKVPWSFEGKNFDVKGLVLKNNPDATPANGIKEFFTADAKNAKIDCATFQSLVGRRSLLEVLGTTAYNDAYKGVGVAGLQVRNDPFSYEAVPGLSYLTLMTGLSLRFHYPDGKGGDYENENTIYIGQLKFIGHPFATPLNPTQMRMAIAAKTGIGMPNFDIVSSIPFQKLPK
jgi:hypothetical protein